MAMTTNSSICEKPLTLTIDEGKKICQVQKQTNRVFQVGTQQRSEFSATVAGKLNRNAPGKRYQHQFLIAVALAHAGKLGKIKKVTCSIGMCHACPPLPKVDVPEELNWEMWLGQAPLADYVRAGRVHPIAIIRPAARITSSAGGTNTPAAR